MTVCGLFVILLTIVIGAFLVYKGSATFLVYKHSFLEFLGSADWAPEDNMTGGGSIGALIFIVGSLCTCGLALLIATPFSLGSAIFITEISPKFGEKFYRPVVEIFAGIPSVVYGWVGLTVLVPAIKNVFDRQVGHSILAAGLVLAVMIFRRSRVWRLTLFTPYRRNAEWRHTDLAPHAGRRSTGSSFRQRHLASFPESSWDLRERSARHLR